MRTQMGWWSTVLDEQASLTLDETFVPDLEKRSPVPFRHTLGDHSAFSLESIARLAESLGDDSVTCEQAVKPLVVTEEFKEPAKAQQAAELVRNLDTNDSWLTLLNIEQNPDYNALIDQVIEATARQCAQDPGSWRRRMGFVFASSPNSVTPAHFDIEHSLIMQLRGTRTLSFGRFADEDSRDQEVHRYWNGSYGRLITLPEPLVDFTIGPGDGAYIPPYHPHWLQNGDSTSLSVTMTFFTRSNEDESLVQVFNEKLGRLGVTPKPVGQSASGDRAKAAVMRTYSGVKRRLRPPAPSAR